MDQAESDSRAADSNDGMVAGKELQKDSTTTLKKSKADMTSTSANTKTDGTSGTAGGPGVASSSSNGTGQELVKKLSVNILKTYNLINHKYYEKKRELQKKKNKRNFGWDDENHDYIVKARERLNDRYVVDSIIGKGSFGQVVKAYDEQAKDYVAIKIVKSKTAFYNQAQIEIQILDGLQKEDLQDTKNIVRMKHNFVHRNHQCIVFELLSVNLYELLRDTGFYGVSLTLIRKFARQLLVALDYTYKHKAGVIHCDLKPENILLRNPRHSAIKVIDFGSACYKDQKMYTYIQSRFYRSPEVLLGCSYSTSIDMWSLGCILVEMHTGKPLFNGSNEQEQLIQQVLTLGNPPMHMLESGKKAKKYFTFTPDGEAKVNMTLSERGQARVDKRTHDLEELLGIFTGGPRGSRKTEKMGHTPRDYYQFKKLVLAMLDYNPSTRITPAQALKHRFFTASHDMAVQTELSIPLDSESAEPIDVSIRALGSADPAQEQKGVVGLAMGDLFPNDTGERVIPPVSSSAPPVVDTAHSGYTSASGNDIEIVGTETPETVSFDKSVP